MAGITGLEPVTSGFGDRRSTNWTKSLNLVPRDRVELPTRGASIHCSTNWAIWAWRRKRDLNPRIPFERIYSLSRGASLATWVLLHKKIGGEEGIRTLVSRKTLTVFKTAPLWPLRYLSKHIGDPSEIRTPDTLIKSQVLYRLS